MAEVTKWPPSRTIMARHQFALFIGQSGVLTLQTSKAEDGWPRMNRKPRIRIGWRVLCLTALFAASEARAAEQGALGAISTGSIGISASIATQAAISGSGDIGLGGVGRTNNRVAQNLCLTSNSRLRSYTVAAISGGSAGAFELSDGHRTIGYIVGWTSAEETSLTEGGRARATIEAALSQVDCTYGSGATVLTVAIDPEHLDEVRTGTPLTGIFTLMVSPG